MKKIIFSLFLMALISLSGTPQTGYNPMLGKDPVKKVIDAMTLEEKAALVVGTGMRMPGVPAPTQGPVVGATQSLVLGAAGTSYALTSLGFTSLVLTDGQADLVMYPTRRKLTTT